MKKTHHLKYLKPYKCYNSQKKFKGIAKSMTMPLKNVIFIRNYFVK